MPFAVIAVTLLILGSACGAVCAMTERASDNAGNLGTELEAISEAMGEMGGFVNRGLGEIIGDISRDPSGGVLKERSETFSRRAGNWMRENFPMTDGCVTATLVDYRAELGVESLRMAGAVELGSGSVPSYLTATGSFTAEFRSPSGYSLRTVDIRSDGTYALPLVLEKTSLFEQSLTEGVSVLSQMMTYQLSSLAQTRVINGYGSESKYGDMGTSAVLTPEDAEEAYRVSLAAIGMICFRDSSDELISGSGCVDLADMAVLDDGYLVIDLGSVYAQAMVSVLDDLLLQWVDYSGAGAVIDSLEILGDHAVGLWNCITGFLTGENPESAAGYLADAMRLMGHREEDYRYLLNGTVSSIDIEPCSFSLEGGTVEVGVSGDFAYPDVDVIAWSGLDGFLAEYRDATDNIRETFRGFVRGVALDISERHALGTIRIAADPSDGEDFLTTLGRAVSGIMEDGGGSFFRDIGSCATSQEVLDPLCGAIFERMDGCRDEIFGISELESSVRGAVAGSLRRSLPQATEEDLAYMTEVMMSKARTREILDGYRETVDERMERLESIVHVEKGDNALRTVFTAVADSGFSSPDAEVLMKERMSSLLKEISENMSMYGSGITELPGEGSFRMTDGSGRITEERMRLSRESSPEADVGMPWNNSGGCVHYVGFMQDSGASYSSVYTVRVKDSLSYSVDSSNTLLDLLGAGSCHISGSVTIDLTVDIPVMSSWALAGVSYSPSNTLLGDAWNLLLEVLEPLLEPLRKAFGMLMDIVRALSCALVEISKYVADIVSEIFEAIMEPMEYLRELIEGALLDTVGWAAENALAPLVDISSGEQGVGVRFFGLTLMISTKAQTWMKSTKTILKVSLAGEVCGIGLKCGLTVDKNSSGKYGIVGSAEVRGEDWDIDVDFDPLMKSTKHLVSVDGSVGGTDFRITLPELVQYEELTVSLSDLPGVGAALSNIPLPIPGLKGSIDAGLDLKYNVPFERGVLINEFESNPYGSDTGFEWVELYNSTERPVDLTGWTLHAGSNEEQKLQVIIGEKIPAKGRLLVELDTKVVLVNASSNGRNGDCVILRDSSGSVSDKTPWKTDTQNSDYTWQRIADAASEWIFAEGSPDQSNGGGLIGGSMMRSYVLNIFKDSACETFADMASTIKGLDDLGEFFEKMMRKAIEKAIDMIAGCIVEASVFVTLDVTDYSGSAGGGIRISLSVGSDLVKDTLFWLVGQIESLIFNVDNPCGMSALDAVTDNTYLRTFVHAGISAPRFMAGAGEAVDIGISIGCNLSGICNLFGHDIGRWRVEAGVVVEGCPHAAIPSGLGADRGLESDLWLLKAVFERRRA